MCSVYKISAAMIIMENSMHCKLGWGGQLFSKSETLSYKKANIIQKRLTDEKTIFFKKDYNLLHKKMW